MISNSLDWDNFRRDELKRQIEELPYNRDLRMMLNNIDTMVTALSRAEVVARRTRREVSTLSELAKVNQAIETLEKWIVMAALLR